MTYVENKMKKIIFSFFTLIFIFSVSTAQPIRSHPIGTWKGDNLPMLHSFKAAPADTNYWQYINNLGDIIFK